MSQKKFEFILSKSVSHQSKAVLLGCTLLVLAGSLHPVLANLSDPFFQAVLVISGSPLHWINTALIIAPLVGVLVAVVLSLINVLYHISKPHDALLDDIDASGGTVYREIGEKATSMAEPGLIVYRFDAPLVFPNAG